MEHFHPSMKLLSSFCILGLALSLGLARADEPKKEETKPDAAKPAESKENKNSVSKSEVAVIKTTEGEMVVEFWPDVAPQDRREFQEAGQGWLL
jgi:hypothetical protein